MCLNVIPILIHSTRSTSCADSLSSSWFSDHAICDSHYAFWACLGALSHRYAATAQFLATFLKIFDQYANGL
jgi:hypothetical protein